MTTGPDKSALDATREWDAHLASELERGKRAYTLDMDDQPEQAFIGRFPGLNEALDFLNKEVGAPFRSVDAEALRHHDRHRILARLAILGGGSAVAFAILQLALKPLLPSWAGMTAWLEAVASLVGTAAVVMGLWARSDHQWLIQRDIAERLRLLKFHAFGQPQLWCGEMDAWRAWVRERRDAALAVKSIEDVKRWSGSGDAEPFEPVPPDCVPSETELRAFTIYYRRKRVDFQVAYFHMQSETYRKKYGRLQNSGLPLFVASVVAVVVHFVADRIGHGTGGAAADAARQVGIWALTLAVLLPVASFGIHAWLGAFEGPRSANLFAAKHHALKRNSRQITRDEGQLAPTMHHIAHIEHFLEHEHREWLRLMIEAEWI